jgi:uncharacterized membrane protein (DUF373 family)
MHKLNNILDKIVSFVITLVAIRLVLYIVTSFGYTIYMICTSGLWIANREEDILHQIVFMIILVKAYKILIYYAKFHHVNIRYIAELVIISTFIEFIFNLKTFNTEHLWIIGIVGISTLFLYLKYNDKFKDDFKPN